MRSLIHRILVAVLSVLVVVAPSHASEQDAVAISRNIRALHMPHRTLIDPIFESAGNSEVDRYTRGGDSAIWTGHYLAAEAFRYGVTRSPEALANARKALGGIRWLVDVTGKDLLARCLVPIDWEDTFDGKSIITEEQGHGIYEGPVRGRPHYWVGNTSRDQYCGVFFGLSVAYETIGEADHPKVRPLIRRIVTKLLNNLVSNDWAVVMPDGTVSTVFTGRFDQQLCLLQVGRQVDPAAFESLYERHRSRYADLVAIPVAYDCLDEHGSYFKFNLDYINLYTLIRLEEGASPYRDDYLNAYEALRFTTRNHGNAHFNVIDRALTGADSARDAETGALLDAWLARSRRDEAVDQRCCYQACGDDKACSPIAVEDRVRTDFLWQRSPFLLYGGGSGLIETAGIDYILPYWMGRYYRIAL
jgi:hypothetical protein